MKIHDTGSSLSKPQAPWLGALISGLLVLVTGCFLGSLLVGLGHPLFWNDEGMTVMHAKRVAEFGYPKAWDGKNMVYDLLNPDKELGLDKRTGAYIGGSGWGHYYYAAPIVAIADSIEDDNRRTAFIRLWFVLAGIAGVGLMARLLGRALPSRRQRHAAMVIFLGGLLMSVPLALHLREARYYSLCVLLMGAVIGLHARAQLSGGEALLDRRRWIWHQVVMTLLLVLLLLTFAPSYLAIMAALATSGTFRWIASGYTSSADGKATFSFSRMLRQTSQQVKQHVYLLLAGIALVPFLWYFRTFEISNALLESNTRLDFYSHYSHNVGSILDYLLQFEPFVLMLVLKLGVAIVARGVWKGGAPEARRQLRLSGFLLSTFLFHLLFSARIPNDIFIRYFIPMIPLLHMQIALDGLILWNWLCPKASYWRVGFASLFTVGWLSPLPNNLPHLKGHVAELRTPVMGHLDHMIPFIKGKYDDHENLVIAANYEETCFMYYLDCKVTVGYVQQRLEEDLRHTPDIIYFNSYWSWGEMPKVMDQFLARHKYGRAIFPVGKYRVNNIPEVNYKPELEHQYVTRTPRTSTDHSELLLRID